jgi:Secretion system C-terminal sorting domain/Galactose oxidase, central domain
MKMKNSPISNRIGLQLRRSFILSLLLYGLGMPRSQAQTIGDWTWFTGSNTPNQTSTYGTLGVTATTNVPGARYGASGGLGQGGTYFWLFGGTNGGGNYFNDLWTCGATSGEWTWISGKKTSNNAGIYGTKGVSVFGNMPGARYAQCGWTDKSGNTWIFGGYGYDGGGSVGYLNDLWMFNPDNFIWTWEGGGSTANSVGVYGTRGTAAAGNVPGGRDYQSGWMDASGNFWIFGGLGYDVSTGGYLNDLWEFNPTTGLWTWMSGSTLANQPGSYGTQGVALTSNVPPGRYIQSSGVDPSGSFWIFGGKNQNGFLNDLWKYDSTTNEWTWVSGSSSMNNAGVYGTLGVASASNVPGSRFANLWIDHLGNIWLFGGAGYDAAGNLGDMNDLWEFSASTTGQWTWVDGSSTVNSAGSYGAKGIGTTSNQPPARQVYASWADAHGNFYLFGGAGTGTSMLNDLWEYTPMSVLSVQELTLQVVSKSNENVLTWQTVNEINTARFVVERSTNGVDFTNIGYAAAAGNGNNRNSFVDADPPAQAQTQVLYRIEAEDQQGAVNYSNVVHLTGSTGSAFIVFPNPATTGVTLEMGDAGLLNTPARLFDVNGRLVGQQLITGQQQYIDLQQLAAGVYFLQLTNSTIIKVIKK